MDDKIKNRIKNLSHIQMEILIEKLKKRGIDVSEFDYLNKSGFSKIEEVEQREYYPVSSAQKRILLLDQIEQDSINYNIPVILKIKGNLNKDLLINVFKKLVNRHESLRTSFEFIGGEPVQKIHDYKELDFEVEVIKAKEGEEAEIIKRFIHPFNLNKAPLIKVCIIEGSIEEHILLLDMHHIISDGVSINILLKEITELYQGKELKDLEIQYKDFTIWQNALFKCSYMDKQKEYWLERFSDEIPALDLPTDYPRPKVRNFEGYIIDFELGESLTDSLKNLCKETNSTLYMVLLAVYNVVLSKYSGQEDIIIGSPIAGRRHADLENIVGMFVNTLAIRNYPKEEKSFIEFLKEVRENTSNAYENQDYQFEELVNELKLRRDLSRNPLFDVMFAMQNMGDKKIELGNLEFKNYNINFDISKFDMTLSAKEDGSKIKCELEYSTKLFKKDTIERFINRFVKIVEEVVNKREIKLSDIEIITEEEKEEILYKFNDTKIDYTRNKTLDKLFEEQVERTPDNIALVFMDKELTYRELNKKSNQLARVLREKGVKEETIVGIMVERSLEMIIGIMAILKAGGAYLPIDSTFPVNRINYMLDDSNVNILLTQNKFKNNFKYNGEVLDLENECIYQGDSSNLQKISNANNLVYIIYTSGSTGKPKGVMVEHKGVVNTLLFLQREYPLKENDSYVLKTNYAFDVSVTELFGFIFGGSKLVILENGSEKDPVKIIEKIEEEKITHINFTPSMLKLFIDEVTNKEKINSLKYIFSAGEDLKNKTAKEINSLFNNIKCENLYGPTEASIYATKYSVKEIKNEMRVPIGKPISNTKLLVIDRNYKLQPIGVAGELCIIGDGVARGYLNREDLTKEKFVQNPYGEGSMYKTGDLARWLSDGNIEYLGRMDNQIKIRGYRVELGAIESQLLNYEDIKEAVVLAKGDSANKYLIEYVVSEKKLSITELKEHLSKSLPEYMIPPYFVQLDEMPLNKNGKVDRKALPEFNGNKDIGEDYVEPKNDIELKLVNLWEELLKVDRIGTNDNFFDLGGHSLKAIELVSKIHRGFNVQLEIRKVFELKTIKNIAQEIKEIEGSVYSKIEAVEERAYYPVSSVQKRLLLLDQIEEDNINYNMPGAINIKGNLNKDLLLDVFKQLLNRHESLRTSFEFVEGEPVQKIHDYKELDFKAEVIKEKEGEEQEIMKGFIRPFDLNKAPLIRVGLIEKSDEEYILLLDMHHIISDGVSINILFKEITELYQGKELQELEIQYKDFAIWQNELFKSSDMDKQRKYWLDRFQDEIPVLDLPTDYPRPKVQNFEGERIEFELSEGLTKSLKNLCKETNTTLYMVLLSVYNILLSKYSGQEDIIIGSPIAGRTHADLENIVGMFVNTLAIRNYPKGEKNFIEFLDEVRENTLNAYKNQDYQFEKLVDELKLRRDLSRNPLFDVMFSMLNMGNQKIELENLEFKDYSIDFDVSKFDMTLYAIEERNRIRLQVEYATRLFKKESIERFITYFLNIVEKVVNKRDVKISEVEIITKEEREEILYKFNDTKVNYPKDKTVYELFEEQAERTPNNIAVVFEDKELTYKELNERANQLARVLREKGVKEETIVGIMVERSLEMIIGIMAILKAGGAYLPIDPNYPMSRINYMLDDSSANMLLTQNKFKNSFKYNGEVIDLEDEFIYQGDSLNLKKVSNVNNLAYVIYTSGSTGKPKGVMIEHHSLVNRLKWMQKEYPINENDTILQKTTFTFDVSVWEMFWWAIQGAKVCFLEPEGEKDPQRILDTICKEKISIMHFVPSMLTHFLNFSDEKVGDIEKLSTLRQVFVSGEELKLEQANRFNKLFNCTNGTKLANLYGPTEATIDVTFFNCSEKKNIFRVPIGKPIDNISLYIINKYKDLQPIGVIGELCITGDGVARGYLNREELTKEKFVDNPFGEGKMYKTGDLARWLPDGNIEYLDRIDNQVKIKGYRIELEEIESKLLNCDDIKEASVIAKEDVVNKYKYLIGYVVSETKLNTIKIKESLSNELPDYMIPSYFIQLEKMPIKKNGKLDKKALPELDGNVKRDTEYVEPENEIEARLIKLWEETLRVDNIGRNDNFFDLGGHSLKVIELVSKIHKEFDVEIKIRKIFELKTIKNIAQNIKDKDVYELMNSSDLNKLEKLLDDIEFS